MASRPAWRGSLRLALVSCPVALYTAQRDAGDLHFHFINPQTGHRVQMVTLDAETGEEVARRDLVRGYEFEKDHYLILEDADFESARIESSTTMVISKFIDQRDIDPVYFAGSYYCAPDDSAAADVYAVLHEAIRASRRVALSRVVIARRERAVAIMPHGPGLIAHVLREEQDIVSPAELFAGIEDVRPDPEMVRLAQELMQRQAGRLEPADLEDHYESKLRAVIEAKLHGEETQPEAPAAQGNVIDLMAALRQSLGQTPPRRPARQTPAARTGKRKPPARRTRRTVSE